MTSPLSTVRLKTLLLCITFSFMPLQVVKTNLDDLINNQAYQTPIISMCDFPKTFRPENKMANTGFLLVRNEPSARVMVERWFEDVYREGKAVENDQPPFQEIAKLPDFRSSHRCSDEKEGFAMWFHKKKISGSGLNKQWYFQNSHLIKVVTASALY